MSLAYKRMFYYEVMEHYDGEDDAPEPFGDYLADRVIRHGDLVELKWLDGRYAYTVKVFAIHGGTLHVRKVEDPGPTPGHNED